jgi:hypothetical protein
MKRGQYKEKGKVDLMGREFDTGTEKNRMKRTR